MFFSVEDSEKCGIHGTHMKVLVDDAKKMDHYQTHERHHHHASLSQILSLIDSLSLPDSVKQNAKHVYQLTAEAESHVHHTEIGETIRLKVSEGYGTVHSKYEYDDLVRLAEKKGRSPAEIREEIRNGMKK